MIAFGTFVATVVLASAAPSDRPEPVPIVSRSTVPLTFSLVVNGRPVAFETIDVTDTTGHLVRRRTNARGEFALPAGFVVANVALARAPAAGPVPAASPAIDGTIARVSVATGDSRSLHRLPVAASSLDRATIVRAPAVTTDALLRQLPGFDAVRSNSSFTNYGQLRVSIGGSGNDRGALLVDGVPGQDGFGGQVDWQAYAPGDLVGAELLRGPGSALYGSRAIGGTLALTTFAPPALGEPPVGDFSYTLGDRELRDLSARYGATLGGRLSASASVDERHEAYRDIPPDQGTPIDAEAVSTETTTHLRARYDAGAAAISFGTIQAYDDQEEGRPNYRFGRTFGQYDAAVDVPLGSGALHAGAYARDAAVVNVADQTPKSPGVLRYTQNVPTYENGIAARYLGADRPFRLEAVADLRDVRGESRQTGPAGALQSDASGGQRYLGLGLQATLRERRFEVLGGLRADRIDQFDESISNVGASSSVQSRPAARRDGALSPRLAVRYDLSPRLALRLSGGDGFRAPYLNELIRGYQIGSVVYAPNADLVPERTGALGAGLDLALPRGRLAIDLTRTYVRDAILFVTQSATLQQRENVGTTRTDGVTAEYRAPLRRCIDLRLFATGQHARVTAGPPADLGKVLAFVPTALAGVGIGAKSGASALDVDVAYAGPAFADDVQAQPLGTAVLTSARLSTSVGGAVVSVFGENLTDALYRSSVDRYGPPSTLGLRVALRLGRQSDVAPAPCARAAGPPGS